MLNFHQKERIWAISDPVENEGEKAALLARELGVSMTLAKLLCRRGYETTDDALRFFNCTDAVLHRPSLMRDMDKGAARVEQAIEGGEYIAIYGDYDVDGVTAVSLLYLYLTSRGARVTYYIPSRTGEGYGLSTAAIDRLAGEGVSLIITVDTGITANEEAKYAASLGIDMVITDHHECRLPLPMAVAVIDPHRPDCSYPFKELAGVGVAFKLVCAVESARARAAGEREAVAVRRVCDAYADLVAIGTVADVMPMRDENRVLVKRGIELLDTAARVGLSALIDEVCGKAPDGTARRKRITSSFIGFTLAPRLNAAGRMSDASLAVRLLLSKSKKEACALARELCEINLARQQEENRIADEVYRQIEEELDIENTSVIVLAGDHWRQGIIGIVASRVTERYGLPSILISFDGAGAVPSPQDQGKGSGRSVKGVNLVEALTASEEHLVKFGGHELAAGLTVRRDRLDDFRRHINAFVAANRSGGESVPHVHADMELTLEEATLTLAEEIVSLEPFGATNPLPQFVLRELLVERIAELGGGKHLKLTVRAGDRSLFALLFSTTRSAVPFAEGDRVDLLCTVDVNEFRDVRSVQLTVQDVKLAASEQGLWQEKERYRAVMDGAAFGKEEGLLPDRDFLAHAYRALLGELKVGRREFDEHSLTSLFERAVGGKVHYALMKIALAVLGELAILDFAEWEGVYRFTPHHRTEKTSIDNSVLLARLKAQCTD